MARRNKMTILKRQRERKKAEKAAIKREQRAARQSEENSGAQVASADDLEAYGVAEPPEDLKGD